MAPTAEDFRRGWDALIHRAQQAPPDRPFAWIQHDLLNLLAGLDIVNGKVIPQGIYRQKGNRFRDLVRVLLYRKGGIELHERELFGLTDRHKVDLAFPLKGEAEVAIEVKMAGRPAHPDEAGQDRPVRGGEVDFDKRLKEVKYTPIDLKLKRSGLTVGRWDDWLLSTPPKFFSVWAYMLGNEGRLDGTISKFLQLSRYNNGVGVLLFRDTGQGYQRIADRRLEELDIDIILDQIVGAVRH